MSGKEEKRHWLKSGTEAESESVERGSGAAAGREFGGVEEVLRADRAGVVIPAEVANKVARAVEAERASRTSWWSRWFSGGTARQD